MQENKLVLRAQKGDNDAFSELVSLYEKKIYNLALRMTRDREDALDLSQEIFIRIYKSLPLFKAQSTFSTWVYSIASNACIDFTRRESKRKTHSIDEEEYFEIPDLKYSPENSAENSELREQIVGAIDSLSPEHREVIVLRELNGLSYDEIADALDISPGTVKSRICRAREKMCSFLSKHGNNFGGNPSKNTKGR